MTHRPPAASEDAPALEYRSLTTEEQDEFLSLLREHMSSYVERTMELMQMTWPEFEGLVRRVGQLLAVCWAAQTAGYVWIEQRDRTLHVHGILLKPPFRSRGLGTRVFRDLATTYAGPVDVMELGVQYDNVRARALYERLGFRVVKDLVDLGFYVMQKPLPT
jgi:ribosomal protein S18 acetylase RimI-like enzyme